MSCKKRVFATNEILNYKDVYTLKNGCEILKTIKREDNIAVLGQFKNYYHLQTLTTSYYPFIDNNDFVVGNVHNLCEANDSFVDFSKREEQGCRHNKRHTPCGDNKPSCCDNKPSCCDNMPFCDNKPLSFKGHIIKKRQVIPCSSQPSNIYLCKWNNEKCIKPINPFRHCNCSKPSEKCSCRCACSLCKNAKPLFI